MGYELQWRPKGVVKRFFGFITGAEILQSINDVEGDWRFDDLRYVIDDFLGVRGFDISFPEVDEYSAIDGSAARINPKIKVALVTADAELTLLCKQYAESPLNRYPTKIVATLEDAQQWIEER
jgi:hypothetical protein